MERSPALTPLSHDHQVALEAALRLRRADADSLGAAVTRFERFWNQHGSRHFEIEEEILLPACDGDEQAAEMAQRVRREHADIRGRVDALRGISAGEGVAAANELGELLHDHVRFEERELFELLEERFEPARLEELGRSIELAENG